MFQKSLLRTTQHESKYTSVDENNFQSDAGFKINFYDSTRKKLANCPIKFY